MILELLDNHGAPHRLEASRVVIRDQRTGTLLGLAMEVAPGQYLAGSMPVLPLVATASEQAAFQKLLDLMRIRETVLVTSMTPGQLGDLPSIG